MQTLSQDELASASGGIAPAVAVVLTVGGLYGAAKTAYEFGKALGGLLVSTTPDDAQNSEE